MTSLSQEDGQATVAIQKELMAKCIALAKHAPALPTNFRVGAMLVARPGQNCIVSGYTHELPGNTHAEQVCLTKVMAMSALSDEGVGGAQAYRLLREGQLDLYTTVEPCVKRLSGEKSCVERILETQQDGKGIQTVYVGVSEPDTFITNDSGRAILEAASVKVIHVTGLEDEILEVAEAGHAKPKS